MNRLFALTFSCLTLALQAMAVVKLPAVISDGAVIQRDRDITIWGTAEPGERVTVTLAGCRSATAANSDGNWEVSLKPMAAGGPYTLTVNDITVSDLMIGDVYLCSGQSNMELPVSRTLDLYADEVSDYSNPCIRELKVNVDYSLDGEKSDLLPTSWKVLTPENAQSFSALAYYMARRLYNDNGGVPVGIINSSWGGTHIEAWISLPTISRRDPMRANRLRLMGDTVYQQLLSQAESRAAALWHATLTAGDKGYTGAVKWSDPSLDDSGWERFDIFDTSWGTRSGMPVNGAHWLRKTVTVDSAHAGREAVMRLGAIVDADSVFVNGKCIGTTGYRFPPRVYNVPAGLLREGDNNITVRVVSNSGTPCFVAEKPYDLTFADGTVTRLDGTWRHRLGNPMPQAPGFTYFFQAPTAIYNAMIAPLSRLKFDGTVWYQGESDVDISPEYALLLESLIDDWRERFDDPGMPFYIVELADYLHPSETAERAKWSELRRQQRLAADNRQGAVLIENADLGEWNDIHPADKKTPGERVAAAIVRNRNNGK